MLKKQNMFFSQKTLGMANIIIFGSLPKPNSVHFLPIITIPQVNLNFVCVCVCIQLFHTSKMF